MMNRFPLMSRINHKYRFVSFPLPPRSDSLWLGTRNRFNEQLNSTTARYTYFVPRDKAWRSLENEFPSVYKKLFMDAFSYHVSFLESFTLWINIWKAKFFNPRLRPTSFWSVIWLWATAFSPWANWETCQPAAISFLTAFVTSWRSAFSNTISVSFPFFLRQLFRFWHRTLFNLFFLICIPELKCDANVTFNTQQLIILILLRYEWFFFYI